MDFLIEHDYEGHESDELSIKKGDIIKNARIHEEGWMIGTLKGKEGVFPDNFGREYKDTKQKDSADDSKDTSNDEELDDAVIIKKMEEKSKNKVKGVGFGNIFSGQQIKLKHTSMNDVKAKSVEEEQKKDQSATTAAPKSDLVRVLFSYTAENPDELSLDEGDIITVTERNTGDEGWWRGKHPNGKLGVFPDNYVEPLRPDETSTRDSQISKLVKPQLRTPPPVTAPKPTPVRPSPLDPKAATAKPSSRGSTTEKEETGVSFDSAAPVHVPLVGPTADRPKRPGKRSNIVISTPENEFADEKPIQNNVTKSKQHREESVKESERSPLGNHYNSTKTMPNAATASSSPAPSPSSNPPRSNTFHNRKKSRSPGRDIERPDHTSASTAVTVTALAPTSVLAGDSAALEAVLQRVAALETKTVKLEESNADLSRQLRDQRKQQSDQLSLLTTKLQKLTNELDEEKAKKASMQIELKRVKDTVEDLERDLIVQDSLK